MGLPRSSLVKPKHLASTAERLEFAPTELSLIPPAPPAPPAAPVAFTPMPPVATADLTGPTPRALLERAAALGAARPTWESIVLPDDPVLHAKRRPEIAERRAKFRRLVKGTLGVCAGLCLVALVVSIVSGDPETASAATTDAASKTAPAKAEASVTKIDTTKRSKAASAPAPAMTLAARRLPAAPAKRR